MGFSKNSSYPPPPCWGFHFQKCTSLEFQCFFFSFPGIPSKLSPPPGIFPFFSFYPLEFSKFKTPWNSVVLNSGVRTISWKSPIAESITSYHTLMHRLKWQQLFHKYFNFLITLISIHYGEIKASKRDWSNYLPSIWTDYLHNLKENFWSKAKLNIRGLL